MYCQEFINASKYIYKWLDNQPSVNEESLTDWLLYNLSDKLPAIKYIQFTRHQEARVTGADWEWWFVDKNHALSLRIQAKKIKENTDNYSSIAYTNKYGLQIEKLIDDAESKNFLPFYTFYYAPKITPPILCEGMTWGKTDTGIFISSATTIYDKFIIKGKTKIKDTDILDYSNPLHCLVCCQSAQSVQNVYDHIQRYYPKNPDNNKQGFIEKSEIPQYVKVLLESKGKEIHSWFEEEFHQNTKEIKALIVVDLSQKDNKTE
jgi:hypothetical protein